MFYASFVLNKKGPLARIWLAAHWDKKLTKAHVFETNIDSSVEAILKPKVKMALRTSGHLLLGVVRIYSRKAKYLLADCNEAFVKIKMAFRPGMVDLPEENREAAVAAITLQENFHDFETTLADLEDINVQAQFSVNQSRPEEITMREDLGQITLMGDDGFGDVGFEDREMLPEEGQLDDGLYKTSEREEEEEEPETSHTPRQTPPTDHDRQMDIDLPPPVVGDDGFGGGFMEDDGCDEDNDDNFGDVDQDFFGQDFMGSGGLFEDTPALPDASTLPSDAPPQAGPSKSPSQTMEPPVQAELESTIEGPNDTSEQVTLAAPDPGVSAVSSIGGEQTTLVHNEEEAFALEPLDITTVPGTERKGKRKRKLIVDEQKGIPSETMKLQLSDCTDIVTSLDLAPPTKKLMLWKETGGVEKVFVLPGRPQGCKVTSKFFSRNLVCKQVSEDFETGASRIDLDMAPELARENERNTTLQDVTRLSEMSTIAEEPSVAQDKTLTQADVSRTAEVEVSHTSERSGHMGQLSTSVDPMLPNESLLDQLPDALQPVDVPPMPQDVSLNPLLDDGPPSVAPFSVPPPSVPPASVGPASVGPPSPSMGPMSVGPMSCGPPSCGPPSVGPMSMGAPNMTFEDLEQEQQEEMPETVEEEEKRWSKRTQKMQSMFERAFTFSETLSFKDMAYSSNRKQAASRFYTLLVLKKHQAICTEQTEAFGDILITEGPNFGIAC